MNGAPPAANTRFRPTGAALDHLGALEAESVYILREVAGQLERPVLLFSGGKDSAVLLRLSEKAFRPGPFPFPVLHVDTGHNFPEVLDFRDRRMAKLGERLIVRRVQDSIDRGRATDPAGPDRSRNRLQSVTLLDAIAELRFDCAIGGARRGEGGAPAKEGGGSFRHQGRGGGSEKKRAGVWVVAECPVPPGGAFPPFP